MGHESGFITPPQHADSRNDYHDLQPVSETQLSLLTMAVRDGRRWMLKSLPQQLQDSAMHRALQQKEYDILCRLSHPAIVSVVEMADVPTLGRCIVMEYVDGVTLDALRADTKTRRHLARQLAEAVAYIHAHQVVHRDLKPTNIMVTHNGRNIKIIDFGLADTDAHTILKQPAGTPGYMSAEQQAESRPDVRNDIYSLGIIFGQMHLGWPYRRLLSCMTCPLERRVPNMDEVMRMMAHADKKPVRLLLLFAVVLCLGTIGLYSVLIKSGKTPFSDTTPPTEIPVTEPDTTRHELPADILPADNPTQTITETSSATSTPTEAHDESTKHTGSSAEALVQRGKTLLDAYLQQQHFKEMADTIQIPGPNMIMVGEIFGKAQSMVNTFADTCSADANVQEMVRKQVDEYIVAKYWRSYFERVKNAEY